MDVQQREAFEAHLKLKLWIGFERNSGRMTAERETASTRILCCLSARTKNDIAPPTAVAPPIT